MIVNAIEGATRRIGKAQGYRGLPIRDFAYDDGTPAMRTSWQPTPAELKALAAGAPIYVTLLGSAHPPILLEVGAVPE
jgi:hypothetical protein